MNDLRPPELDFTTPVSDQQIHLVLDRVVYLLQWVAENPVGGMRGRQHETFRSAIDDLMERLGTSPRERWKLLFAPGTDAPGTDAPGTDAAATDAAATDAAARRAAMGLVGRQLAFKVGVFTQAYDEFRDEAVLRENKVSATAMHDLEDFASRVLPWYRKVGARWRRPLKRALTAGGTLIGSIIQVASPQWKERLEGLEEMVELAVGAVEALD